MEEFSGCPQGYTFVILLLILEQRTCFMLACNCLLGLHHGGDQSITNFRGHTECCPQPKETKAICIQSRILPAQIYFSHFSFQCAFWLCPKTVKRDNCVCVHVCVCMTLCLFSERLVRWDSCSARCNYLTIGLWWLLGWTFQLQLFTRFMNKNGESSYGFLPCKELDNLRIFKVNHN